MGSEGYDGMSRRSFLSSAGSSLLLAASGLLLPGGVYAGEKSDEDVMQRTGLTNGGYRHFLCDSIVDNKRFDGLKPTKDPRDMTAEWALDGLVENAVDVKGHGKKYFGVGDKFYVVFFEVGFPKGGKIAPVINGREFKSAGFAGNEWEYNAWPFVVEKSGTYNVNFLYTPPKNARIRANPKNLPVKLNTSLRFEVGKKLNGRMTSDEFWRR